MKVRSTTKNDKQPKHGRSHLIITPDSGSDSGGDKQQNRVAKAMGKGRIKPGPGKANGPGPKPFEEKRRSTFTQTGKRGTADSGGSKQLNRAATDMWCEGKRSSYK